MKLKENFLDQLYSYLKTWYQVVKIMFHVKELYVISNVLHNLHLEPLIFLIFNDDYSSVLDNSIAILDTE